MFLARPPLRDTTMLGIRSEWVPAGFDGWRHDGKIVDSHVHVDTRSRTLKIFARVAESFNVDTVGSIVYEFGWFRNLPGNLNHYFLPFLSYERGAGVIDLEILEDMKAEGARGVKFWLATRYFHGRKRIDTAEFAEFLREVGRIGLVVVAHISDPDTWHANRYDPSVYGTKQELRDQMLWLVEQASGTKFILVHMGGNPENPRGLAESLRALDNLYLDTSATKWVSRELSLHHDDAVELFNEFPDRILFGTDIVIPPHNKGPMTDMEYYATRYFVQRAMLELEDEFKSPIPDPDNPSGKVLGLGLPDDILGKVYRENARKLGLLD